MRATLWVIGVVVVAVVVWFASSYLRVRLLLFNWSRPATVHALLVDQENKPLGGTHLLAIINQGGAKKTNRVTADDSAEFRIKGGSKSFPPVLIAADPSLFILPSSLSHLRTNFGTRTNPVKLVAVRGTPNEHLEEGRTTIRLQRNVQTVIPSSGLPTALTGWQVEWVFQDGASSVNLSHPTTRFYLSTEEKVTDAPLEGYANPLTIDLILWRGIPMWKGVVLFVSSTPARYGFCEIEAIARSEGHLSLNVHWWVNPSGSASLFSVPRTQSPSTTAPVGND